MISLCPLLPGINKNNRHWQLAQGFLIDQHGAEPVAVGLGGGAVQDGGAAIAAAGGVVPA